MNADLDRIKQEIDIAWLIGQTFTVIGNGHTLTTEEHDSLKIFRNNNSWTWYSQGGRDGKALGGSVIDWYMHVHGCGAGEAIRALSALQGGGALPPAPKRVFPGKQQVQAWKSARWQSDARRRLEAAQDRLWVQPAGEPGRAYLADRGIRLEMAVAFGLGYGNERNPVSKQSMPAILLPWMNRQITAIKYRFIGVTKADEEAKIAGRSKCMEKSQQLLFGLQHCLDAEPGQLQTLFLVEGELNAVSIFQAVYGQVACDVLSFGGQSNIGGKNRDLIAKVAGRYRRVIVWADEPAAALRALGTIPNALPIRSPQIAGKECDANDLLQLGLLDEVIFDLLRMRADG